MKISDLGVINQLIREGTGAPKQTRSSAPPSFRDTLSTLNRGNALEEFGLMSEALSKQGEAVSRRCDIVELKRYKEMLGEYLHEAVRFMYEFKKQSFMDGRGRHRIYAIIKKINQKLEELTQELLKAESDNLAIMAAIDEIRGMLIDLLL